MRAFWKESRFLVAAVGWDEAAHAVTSLSIFMMSSSRRLMSVSMTSSGRGGS